MDENAGNHTRFSELSSDDGSAHPGKVAIDSHNDVCVLPFSSGTTGLPKGVMLTHYSVTANIIQAKYVYTH